MGKGIGLDIGTYAIKTIELNSSKGRYALSGFGYRKIEDHSQEALIDAIKGVMASSGAASRNVNLSVSGPQVIMRFVNMPEMSEGEIRSALAFEVEKNVPFDPSEVVYDHQVLERGKDKKLAVLLTAVKKDYLDRYMNIASACGLEVSVIDADSFALANAFLKNFEGSVDPAKTVALMNIGSRYTNLDILRGEALSFSRDIQMAGRDIDEAIARILNVDIKEAESMKLKPEDALSDMGLPIRTVLGNLADEVRLSFGYFENIFAKGIDEIYISGGSCGLFGLKQFLEEALGAKVNLWDPLKVVALDAKGAAEIPEALRSSLAVGVGLAMR